MIRVIVILVVLMCGFIRDNGAVAPKFEVYSVFPKIVTPTSKTVTIEMVTEEYDIVPTGTIYDITGRKVASMIVEGDYFSNPPVKLKWSPLSNVPAGVYIYQLEGGGQIYNGTIVVAR